MSMLQLRLQKSMTSKPSPHQHASINQSQLHQFIAQYRRFAIHTDCLTTGSRRRPSQPSSSSRGSQAQAQGSYTATSSHRCHRSNNFDYRLSCQLHDHSSWTSSAQAASQSPPSSPTPRPSLSAPAARPSSASQPVAKPDSQKAAHSEESRRHAINLIGS